MLAVLGALFANGLITVLKFVAAVITGSAGMMAEALHSFADTTIRCFRFWVCVSISGQLQKSIPSITASILGRSRLDIYRPGLIGGCVCAGSNLTRVIAW